VAILRHGGRFLWYDLTRNQLIKVIDVSNKKMYLECPVTVVVVGEPLSCVHFGVSRIKTLDLSYLVSNIYSFTTDVDYFD